VRAGAALALLLGACAPTSEPMRVFIVPDCNLAFEAHAKLLTGQPGLAPPVKERGEPYSFHNAANGSVSYIVTEPTAPAHPAILMQRAAGGTTTTTGCAYGDKREFEALKTYIESLKAGGRS
jgi:hypothetical protein